MRTPARKRADARYAATPAGRASRHAARVKYRYANADRIRRARKAAKQHQFAPLHPLISEIIQWENQKRRGS